MNNFNLYLDNLVDQGYDITLVMYWYQLFYYYGCKYDDKRGYRYGYGYSCGYGEGYGCIFGYGDGSSYEYGAFGDGLGYG